MFVLSENNLFEINQLAHGNEAISQVSFIVIKDCFSGQEHTMTQHFQKEVCLFCICYISLYLSVSFKEL